MDFSLTPEQQQFRESVVRFARKELEKDALARAHAPAYPFDVAKLMAQQGLLGITIPEADGGQGGSLMDAVLAIEAVASVCPRSADVIQAGNFGPIRVLAEYGSAFHKKNFLSRLLSGESVISVGMTEPDSQLDPRKVRIGLIMISLVVALAIVLLFVIDDPFGRTVMFAVAGLGIGRAFLLTRSLRR